LPTSQLTLSSFRRLPMCLNLTNGSEVTIVQSCQCCWKFLFEPKEVTYQLRTLGLNEARSNGTLNIKVIGNYISFLKRGETQNFDIRRRNHEALRLIGFSRYGFQLESIFKFCFLMQYDSMLPSNESVLYVPHQKKRLSKYIWRTYSRWQSHSSP
jgi:hypothetical protein